MEHDIATAPAIDVAALHRENAANLCSNSTLVPVGGLGHDDDDAPNFLTEDLVDLQQAEEMRLARVHEQEEQARHGRLYPNAWQTSDLKHVTDNLLHESLGSMQTLLVQQISQSLASVSQVAVPGYRIMHESWMLGMMPMPGGQAH